MSTAEGGPPGSFFASRALQLVDSTVDANDLFDYSFTFRADKLSSMLSNMGKVISDVKVQQEHIKKDMNLLLDKVQEIPSIE